MCIRDRFMGVPSVLINSPNTTAWGSGIEQIMLGFYNLNLRPYLDRWEQAIERILVKRQDRNSTDVMFDFEKILRGDMKSRADYFSKLVQNALMSVNEGRLQLGLPPVPDGNQLMVQANMLPLDELGEEDETDEVAEN